VRSGKRNRFPDISLKGQQTEAIPENPTPVEEQTAPRASGVRHRVCLADVFIEPAPLSRHLLLEEPDLSNHFP
jgi:hypothetical protein